MFSDFKRSRGAKPTSRKAKDPQKLECPACGKPYGVTLADLALGYNCETCEAPISCGVAERKRGLL